ncbi:MAG: transposase [Candidatus Omnitrophota bacterium]|nr:transposase [Candidatus Omnitrophota bacterium]
MDHPVKIDVGCVSQTRRDNELPIRKRVHLASFDYFDYSTVFFITLCAYNKQAYFMHKGIAKVIINEIDFRTTCSQEVVVFTYCIMPDHLHLLLKLGEKYGKTLQNWISAFKRYTTRQVGEGFGVRTLWQKNFYEHVVRKDETLEKIAEYIVHNPVRKGLVDDWQKYPYSRINFEDF